MLVLSQTKSAKNTTYFLTCTKHPIKRLSMSNDSSQIKKTRVVGKYFTHKSVISSILNHVKNNTTDSS